MKIVLKWIVILVLTGVVCFLAALGVLVYMEKHPPERRDTGAIVVLGCQVKQDGSLSLQLEWRLQTALAEYNRAPRRMIVCGAQGDNEPCAEGDAMKTWLVANGVPESDVTAETQSFDTKENLRNAAAMLEDGVSVTVVTSDYHLPRALRIAGDVGLVCDGVGSPCKAEYWAKNHFREVLGWGKYFLTAILGR